MQGTAASSEPLAEAALAGREAEASVPFGAGELVRVAVPVRGPGGGVQGAVLVSTFLPGGIAAEARDVQESYAKFQKAKAFKEPIKAVYLSIYLLAALLILFGAVWLSLYLARRITTPLRRVAEGAERIASGERGVKVEFPSSDDEFTALIASFNRMSERLARSEEEVEHSRAGLTRKNQELEERRRLMETVLETVGTGVVVIEPTGGAVERRACRLRTGRGGGGPAAGGASGPGRGGDHCPRGGSFGRWRGRTGRLLRSGDGTATGGPSCRSKAPGCRAAGGGAWTTSRRS